MRGRLILLLSLLCSTTCGVSSSAQVLARANTHMPGVTPVVSDKKDPILGTDKLHHVLTSAFVAAFAYYYAREEASWSHERALAFGIGVTLTLGASKEAIDKYGGKGDASVADFIADAVGSALGLLIFSGT